MDRQGRLLTALLWAALATGCGAGEPAADAVRERAAHAAPATQPGQLVSEAAPADQVDGTTPSQATPEASEEGEPESTTPRPAPAREALPPLPEYPEEPPAFERPERIRGLYLNAWAGGSRRKVRNLLASVDGTEINAFVLDIKDATGYVSHRSSVPLVADVGANDEVRIGNLHALLWQLREAGIYPIARIVMMKDPRLTAAHPELAVQDTAGGPWVDGKGQVWVNPYKREVWEYHVDLAREVAAAGFPEIQWDYVRFPDAPRSEVERTVYPGQDGRTKAEAIREGLSYTREALADLGVQVTSDVFGVTTSATRDVGIGQVWESFIDVVDVALPMVYPSHYWTGSFGYENPNAYPYEIVYEALTRARDRSAAVSGAGAVRPWLQDFTLGRPKYGPEHVRAQIQATYDAGIEEWILWNPGTRYQPEAWEPEGGWPEGREPMIPVADSLLAPSKALAYLTELRAAEAAARAAAEAAAEAAQGTEEAEVPPEVGPPAQADTIRVPRG